jgi:hypothetical protein
MIDVSQLMIHEKKVGLSLTAWDGRQTADDGRWRKGEAVVGGKGMGKGERAWGKGKGHGERGKGMPRGDEKVDSGQFVSGEVAVGV